MKFTRQLFAFVLLGLMTVPAHAEFFGLGNGRTANMDNMANLSVEAGLNMSDPTLLGARANFKLTPDLVIYGDLGRADFRSLDGFVFGLGAFYQLRNVTVLENTDLAVKASFHAGKLDFDFCAGFSACEEDVTEIAVEALISGDQLSNTNMAWYGSAGIHSFSFLGLGTEIALGGGVVGSLGFGDWYAGLEFIDEIYFTAGIRYNVN